MQRKVILGALFVLVTLAVYWFANKYFGVEVEAMASSLFPSPSAQQVESKQLRQKAGWFSRDCGAVKLRDDPTTAMSCAKDAVREHHSFRVAFEWVGVDSHGLIGLAGTSGGDIYEITTDELSEGGGMFHTPPHRMVTIHKCEKPVSEITVEPRGTRALSCSDWGKLKYE